MVRPLRPKWTEILEKEIRKFQDRLEIAEGVANIAKAERDDYMRRVDALERDLAAARNALEAARTAIRTHLVTKPECQCAFVDAQPVAS